MPVAAPCFSPKAIAFLRSLKRHNDREWFRARKDVYEAELRDPMVALIERLAVDFERFAPELVATPKVSLYRIYRDTRFSPDKSPLKTHVAAIFPVRGLAKHEGAGLYVEVSADRVLIAGGVYAPQPAHLYAMRQHLAKSWRRFRTIVESPAFKKSFGSVGGETLQRVPTGFAKDHPAAALLKHRQFLAGRSMPPDVATTPKFYAEVRTGFERLAPFIRFFNEALPSRASAAAHASIARDLAGDSARTR